MTRIMLPIMGALLALACGVNAKSKKDRIHLYQFTSDFCLDGPKGSNLDLERDRCVPLDGRSIKPMLDDTRTKWLDDVNAGKVQCALAIYSAPGCVDQQEIDILTLPHGMQSCTTEIPTPIRSAKFFCSEKIVVSEKNTTITAITTATSFSVGSDKLLTPYTTTKTIEIVTASPVSSSVALTPTVSERIEPRAIKTASQGGVWLQHPWSGSLICYHCSAKSIDNYGSLKCKSGPEVKASCGSAPIDDQGVATTSTTTVPGTTDTVTVTTDGTYTTATTLTSTSISPATIVLEFTSVSTTTSTSSLTTAQNAPLEARKSWHRRVAFTNPWTHELMCADAEWEKRGKPNTEIRLQDVKLFTRKNCEDNRNIDTPRVVTESAHSTSTRLAFTNVDTITETVTTTTTPGPDPTVFPTDVVARAKGDAIPHSDL